MTQATRTALLWCCGPPSTAMLFAAIRMVFIYAPEERVMGAAQRIFYFHVPIAMVTFASVLLLLGRLGGLPVDPQPRWDNLSRAATEIRSALLQPGADHRPDLGQAGLGRLVDLGGAADHDAAAVAAARGLPDGAQLRREPRPRRAPGRHRRHRRRGGRPDHLQGGGLVARTAPDPLRAGQGEFARPENGRHLPDLHRRRVSAVRAAARPALPGGISIEDRAEMAVERLFSDNRSPDGDRIVKSYDFLFWAYNVIWSGIAGFLLFVLLRLRRTERRLDRVERELERETPPPARPS